MRTNVLEDLDETVKRVPEKIAFANDTTSYSFKNVYDCTNSIATQLCLDGFYKEPILIFMRKSPEEIASFFGVIRSGCYYVPIDEEMPAARISLIIENCKARAMIIDDSTKEALFKLDYKGKVYNYEEIKNTEPDMEKLTEIRDRAIDTDPIYIVFTSGSTGVPKGVCACHRSVLDYIEQLSNVLGFNEETVFGNQSPLYFDACLKEVYPTLRFGATTYLIPHEYFTFPKKIVEYLNEKKINTICWVVSALTIISSFKTFQSIKPLYLHTIAFGSEVFPIKQYRLWRQALPDASFTNLYGPTEGTGMSCYYKLPKDKEFGDLDVIPIGRPFKNTEVMLLKSDNTLAGKDEEGEITLRGTCVTLGYYNNPEKTGEVFVQNPLNTAYPEIVYKTGDIGKYDAEGNLIFVSRKDYQIKHMGHRIELGEVESNVNLVDEIKMSGCIYDDQKGKIVLYYVGDIEAPQLTSKLKDMLPRYMLPNKIRKLEEMPFTPNGKIDRKQLKNIYING
ncbi:MAG: AMP-binding protein [Butyrivibrio sp.]|nr:AMP-binding protein [Butyrivibrio sp.]